ncbi:hypothetical protein Vadar_025713 [Vaccinium darrowii]|uniref:Uncharacterized protein n=1 Tax=Vaccinium darrowii TaxID=229202 RepID=A0ACB7YPT7_9ERIC|nr:hypothetical protein Vadar_025713 [Vaccinium darrowii]
MSCLQVSLPNLEVLIISKLENLETLGDDSLSVGSLSKLEVVFELEGVDTKEPSPEILSALKVKLCDLPKLIYISKGGPIGFKYIQTLEIKGCHSLRYVFAPTVMKSIPQLHELKIRGCEMLSRIVAEENGMGESSVGEVKFPHLERLELHDLPNLVSLFPNVNTARPKSTDSLHNPMQSQSLFNEKVVVPSLKYLKLLGLENVSDLWCSELPSSSFSKLEKLEVITCASLRTIFHPSMSGGLVNLKELLIEGCLTLEGVIGKEEDVGGGHGSKIDKTLFPLLGKLKLASLPNLKRFCNSTHPLELPKLSQMDKLFCPSMDAFSSEPVFAPNLTLPGISWNGDLNNAIQFLQKDDVPCLIVVKVVKSKYSNRDDPMARSMGKLRTLDDVTDNFKTWQVADTQCHMIATPDSIYEAHKVARLLYTNSGNGVLALGCNGIVTWWKMGGNQHNQSGMATASVVPHQWQPPGSLVTNDVTGVNIEEAVPCIALSKNGSYVVSACGGKISLFNVVTFKVMITCMPPPPASTFLAFCPLGNNIIAIGMEDSTIHIYNIRVDEVKCILKGHRNRITGLAFSTNLNILVSSGADAQLCIWSVDTWKKLKSYPIQLPACKVCNGDTSVEFHSDLIRLLVSHETQLAIYDASKMDRMRQWVPQDVLPAPIFCAAYSCDSQLVYTSFCDGNIGVFDADSLALQSRIAPSTYLSPTLLSGSQALCLQFVLAAHPHEPNQFGIGLTDVFVKVMEPPESEGNRGSSPHVDNGMLNGRTASSSNTSNHTPDQKGEEDVVVVDEDLDEDVDEDALIMTRTRTRTATTGMHDEEEDLEEKRKKYEEERKKKKEKAPLLDEDKEY